MLAELAAGDPEKGGDRKTYVGITTWLRYVFLQGFSTRTRLCALRRSFYYLLTVVNQTVKPQDIMSKFVLIDHSLESLGGHNFEYAVHILRAAEQMGYDVVLATNRNFRCGDRLPAHWSVYPLFQYTTYSRLSLYMGGQLWNPRVGFILPDQVRPESQRPWWSRCWQMRIRKKGQQITDSFDQACQRLFQEQRLEAEDRVFLPTLSEFDLLGLSQYLRTDANSSVAHWFLQFHFDILLGREPDFEQQSVRIEHLRRHFQQALSDLPDHRFSFYNTTERIAQQYNRLGLAKFRELSYPVNHEFRPASDAACDEPPLKVALAGHFRREKGRRWLSTVVDQLWDDTLKVGRARLLIQGNPAKVRRLLPKRTLPTSNGKLQASSSPPPVSLVPHPLSTEKYLEFVRQANIGLFLYDSDCYHSRCSGILVEMLSAGVPVIVPAGSWLAEQISEPVSEYLQQLNHRLPQVSSDKFTTNQRQIVCRGFRQPFEMELAVPARAKELLISFAWHSPETAGNYLRLVALQFDKSGDLLQTDTSIVGQQPENVRVPALVRLTQHASHLQLNWSNAYHDTPVRVVDVDASFLGREEGQLVDPPLSSVGLVFADPCQVPSLVREMVHHYSHYRKTAREFSNAWREVHSPQNVLMRMLEEADLLEKGPRIFSAVHRETARLSQ